MRLLGWLLLLAGLACLVYGLSPHVKVMEKGQPDPDPYFQERIVFVIRTGANLVIAGLGLLLLVIVRKRVGQSRKQAPQQ